MAEILTKYGGMTVRTTKSSDIVIKPTKTYTSRGGGGGSSSPAPSPTPRQPVITVKGGEVFINGQGFSVKPSEQESFIKQKGGTITSSIQSQITASKVAQQKLDEQLEQQRREQQSALQKLRESKEQQKLRKTESYDPRTKMYTTPTYGTGAGGTQTYRQPTTSEQARIDLAQKKGGVINNLEIRKEIENLGKSVETTSKQFNRDAKDFEYKYIDKIKGDKFIGTPEEFKEYEKEYNKLKILEKQTQTLSNKYNKRVEETSIEFGFYQYKKKVPITELKNIFSYVKEQVKQIFEVSGKGVGMLYEDVTKVTGKIHKAPFKATGQFIKGEITGKEFASGFKKKDPKDYMSWDLDKGISRQATKEDIIPSQTSLMFVQPKEVEKVSTKVLKTGFYAVPGIGTGIFGLEAAEVGTDIGTTLYKGKKLTTEQKIQGAIFGGIILTAGALKGYKYLKKTPIQVKTPTGYRVTTRWDEFAGKRIRVSTRGKGFKDTVVRTELLPSQRYLKDVKRKIVSPQKTSGVEFIRKEITDTGEKTFSKFAVIREPRVVMEKSIYSKAGKKFFGTKTDVSLNIIKGQPTISKPFEFKGKFIQADKPFVLQTQRLGRTGKLGKSKFEIIYPDKSIKISKEDLAKLSSRQKYLVSETIRKGKLGGTPTKIPSKYIKEEELLSFGNIRKVDVTKQIGRTGRRGETFSIVEPKGKIDEIKLYDVLTGYKETTKPLSRAVGDISTSKIKVFELPPIDKTTAKTFGVSPADIKKTPLATTFAPTDLKSIKILPDIKPKPIKTPDVTTITKSTTDLPLMVGGTGLKTIPYEKTGMYETTELSSISRTGIMQPSLRKTDTQIKDISLVGERAKEKQVQQHKQISLFKEKQLDIQKPFLEVLPLQKIKQAQKLKQTQRVKQSLRQTQIQKLTQAQVPRQVQQLIEPIEPTPTIPFKLGEALKKVQRMTKEKPEVVEAWGKRFGKDVKLGTFRTKKKAEEKLGMFLTKTLGASGYLKASGKKVKATEVDLLGEKGFRKSKVSEFLIVEKKERRLRKSGTGKEIQYFRGSPKKGKKKSLFGF